MKHVTSILTSLLLAPLGFGCGDDLSVGDLRCAGEQTECAQHEIIAPDVSISDTRDADSQLQLQGAWSARIPDGVAVGAVAHQDGSITVASAVSHDDRRGTLLLRYSTEGDLLALDDSLVKSPPPAADGPGETLSIAKLALHGDTAFLAELWILGGAGSMLTVHLVGEGARPHALFTDRETTLLQGFAVSPSDQHFLVSGPVASPSGHHAGTEVTRYDDSGNIVYRQSALAQPFDGPSGNGGLQAAEQEHWMTVDDHGVAYVLTQASGGEEVGLVALEPSGNVRWHARLDLLPVAQIALGPQARPFVVGGSGGIGGLRMDGYGLYRLDGDDPGGEGSRLTLSSRRPDTLFERFSLAIDAQGRALVLADVSDAGDLQRVVERYSADFEQRELLRWPDDLEGWPDNLLPLGDDTFLFWSPDHVGKVQLSAAR